MKNIKYILLVVVLGFNISVFGQKHSTDTIFIKKDNKWGTAQSIYFDSNPNSKYYDLLTDWEFNKYDKESYAASIDFLKEKYQILFKQKPIIAQCKWIPLEQYKGALYVYDPCDFFYHYQLSINDSTLIDWTGEGAIANKIVYQNKIGSTTYEFGLSSLWRNRILRIHIIDKERGIAIFENKDDDENESYYRFMVDSEKVKEFPLIVNNCEMGKTDELKFDKPNFEAVLFEAMLNHSCHNKITNSKNTY